MAEDAKEEGFVSLWDGKTLDGWKINENDKSWKIEDAALLQRRSQPYLLRRQRSTLQELPLQDRSNDEAVRTPASTSTRSIKTAAGRSSATKPR